MIGIALIFALRHDQDLLHRSRMDAIIICPIAILSCQPVDYTQLEWLKEGFLKIEEYHGSSGMR